MVPDVGNPFSASLIAGLIAGLAARVASVWLVPSGSA